MVHLSVFDPSMRSDLENLHWSWPRSVSHWTLPHFANELVKAAVYTNCEEVEVYINEKLIGRKIKKPHEIMFWNLRYAPGSVRTVGYVGGKAVCVHVMKTAGKAVRIAASADRAALSADGQDVSHIEVLIIDEHGELVPDAGHMLTFTAEGSVRVIGVDNGDLCSNEPYKGVCRSAFRGKCLAIVQAGRTAGTATVTVSAEGLEPAVVDLALLLGPPELDG